MNKLIKIPVSAAELIDKITILEIKAKHIKSSDKLSSVVSELNLLMKEYSSIENANKTKTSKLHSLKLRLYKINLSLWKTEDRIRTMESKKIFNMEFIESARMIYTKNDERSAVKSDINILLGSKLSDIKQYKKY
ncbi:MAG: DUF6165 family protein [Ignavibacteria bacterium]|jgi:hypothetical protein